MIQFRECKYIEPKGDFVVCQKKILEWINGPLVSDELKKLFGNYQFFESPYSMGLMMFRNGVLVLSMTEKVDGNYEVRY